MSVEVQAPTREQTRARYPDETGYVERNGVRSFYEVYGEGEPTVFLMPTWSIVHSRHWKMQIPYLARHCRVVTFDGRGNGRSDRPSEPDAYREEEFAADAIAVMDATATDRAIVVSLSRGAERSLHLAASHPERVERMVFIAPALPLPPATPRLKAMQEFAEPRDEYTDWGKWNRHYWVDHYEDFLEFFFSQCFSEPHSTKQLEDTVGWGLETDAETLVATQLAPRLLDEEGVRALLARIDCPTLVIHGRDDAIRPCASGARLAELANGALTVLDGSGHLPHTRDPVKVNLLLRDFIAPPPPPRSWARGRVRRRRALYISSPIGLGHAQRDAAIADELRKLHPDLEVDWLAQHPVTAVLEARGERIHPASAFLANESHHIESESAEHDLHCFQAIRRMDEILLANFMVFHDLVREEQYDLWIGDEAWELDYFLHENPEQKRTPYVWLTDFVGWLPMADGGDHEAFLTGDYNEEMIGHIARHPRVRDQAVFVGNPDDIVPERFAPHLPWIREWTEEHFSFSGYITGFDPVEFADRAGLRAELGYRDDEQVCIVTVGGSGVGGDLLRRVIAAFPEAKQRVPALRMIVVAGPRIAPETLPAHDGLEVRAYVHDLYRHLAACDLAVVQGGLTTSMELTANRRPFLYFPLRHHFEQNLHVRNRLDRYGAGRRMDFEQETPERIAAAIAETIGQEVDYRPVESNGAARAAALIAPLLEEGKPRLSRKTAAI
ncbi:MAG TPA: alpha/beta fold hydrolase [Gaiellaceae bacterium]|nr:alpha/beta fold hydrolase [Gaiellaceae bacterium]